MRVRVENCLHLHMSLLIFNVCIVYIAFNMSFQSQSCAFQHIKAVYVPFFIELLDCLLYNKPRLLFISPKTIVKMLFFI